LVTLDDVLDVDGDSVSRVVGIAVPVHELPSIRLLAVMSYEKKGPALLHDLSRRDDEPAW
jgi:hypothetical protein